MIVLCLVIPVKQLVGTRQEDAVQQFGLLRGIDTCIESRGRSEGSRFYRGGKDTMMGEEVEELSCHIGPEGYGQVLPDLDVFGMGAGEDVATVAGWLCAYELGFFAADHVIVRPN